jgi:hypothetical protein
MARLISDGGGTTPRSAPTLLASETGIVWTAWRI